MTQRQMVLDYMRMHAQGISQLDAYEVLPERVTNLSGRISELDAMGYDIYRARGETADGKHCVFYVLRGEPGPADPSPAQIPAAPPPRVCQDQVETFEAKQEALL